MCVYQKPMVHLHNGILCIRKKERAPTLWVDLDSIMLSEISQVVKNKYHMISPISGTYSTKQTSKQNITRGIDIKNKLTVTRGDVGRNNGGKRGKGCQGTFLKDTWRKPKGEKTEGGRWRRNGDNCA